MTTDTQEWERLMMAARRAPVAGRLLRELRARGARLERDRGGLTVHCDAVMDSPMMFAGATAVLAVLSEAAE